MFLYHGTSFENVPRILSQGLLPRGSENGNWSTSESNSYKSRKDAVYLSDAYAPYYTFAQYYASLLKFYSQQIKPSTELTIVSSKGALIEIDIDSLEQDKFYPDEDFLVRSSNLRSEIGETIPERTEYFGENLESYQDYLNDSLQKMGNCCYLGVIPPTAISRITKWCCKEVKILKEWSYDYVERKGGVTPFHDQQDSQILRSLTKCFAKREFQLYDDYDKKDILIQEMEKIEIAYDKNKGISIFN